MALSQLELTGAEVYAVSLAKGMIADGHRVFIASDTLNSFSEASFLRIELSKRSLFHRIKNIFSLIGIIRKYDIDIIHCHSRAAAWVAFFSCKLTGIPYLVTVHGRQSTFRSRKLLKCLGDYTLAVCEELKKQLVEVLEVDANKIEVLRNGFEIEGKRSNQLINQNNCVTFITRFTGPKGELAINLIKHILNSFSENEIQLTVVGGKSVPDELKQYESKICFTGFVNEVKEYIQKSRVVIASGRTAIESILLEIPTIAIGEAETIGLVTEKTLKRGLETNFGDMAEIEKKFDFKRIVDDIRSSISGTQLSETELKRLKEIIISEYDILPIYKRILSLYRTLYVSKKKREVPVIMYHRVITTENEKGVNGIYVTEEQFEEHLKILKSKGFQSISIDTLISKLILPKDKYIIITFDDGYKDNFDNAIPLLKKYGFNAYIFMITGVKQNIWDKESETRLFEIMDDEQIRFASKNGIEIGGHTLNHYHLPEIESDIANKEIIDNKNEIEEIIGKEISVFAYPYGEFSEETISLVKDAGYKYAFTTDKGSKALHENPFTIRRIAIFPNTKRFGFKRKVKGNYTFR